MYKNSPVASVVCRHGHKRIEAFWRSTKCWSTPTCRKERRKVARDVAFASHLIHYNGRMEGRRDERRKGGRKEKDKLEVKKGKKQSRCY